MMAGAERDQKIGRLLRFLVVGGGFAGFYAIGSALLTGPIGLPVYGTSVVFYALCIPLAFFAQMRLTFGLSRARRRGFLIYALVQVASLAFVTAITTRYVTGHVVSDTLVFLASAGLAAVLSYLVCSRLAFTPTE